MKTLTQKTPDLKKEKLNDKVIDMWDIIVNDKSIDDDLLTLGNYNLFKKVIEKIYLETEKETAEKVQKLKVKLNDRFSHIIIDKIFGEASQEQEKNGN